MLHVFFSSERSISSSSILAKRADRHFISGAGVFDGLGSGQGVDGIDPIGVIELLIQTEGVELCSRTYLSNALDLARLALAPGLRGDANLLPMTSKRIRSIYISFPLVLHLYSIGEGLLKHLPTTVLGSFLTSPSGKCLEQTLLLGFRSASFKLKTSSHLFLVPSSLGKRWNFAAGSTL